MMEKNIKRQGTTETSQSPPEKQKTKPTLQRNKMTLKIEGRAWEKL